MIEIIDSTNGRLAIVSCLNKSSFTFWLTGSRFFGTEKPHSDWDFFTEDSKEVRDYLTSLNFFDKEGGYNKDPLVSDVFRHWQGVDVQLIPRWLIETKKEVQRNLYEHCTELRIGTTKERARMFWILASRILLSQTEVKGS